MSPRLGSADEARVLVVDDDEPMRRMIAGMVGTAGFDVETVADAAEARVRLTLADFALVISDLNLPGESGEDLVAWIREEHPDVVDVFDALTNDRVYRPAFARERALEIMREGRGTQFDAAVLDAFEDSLGGAANATSLH